MHRIFRVPIFAGARKRKSSEILEFQSFALICYLLSRCVRKMNLISIPHVLNWKIQCKLPPKTKRFCPLVLK